MNLYIIDFDGTLVDVWNRYYSVFNNFWGIKNFEIKEYRYYKQKLQFDDLIVKKKMGLVGTKTLSEYKLFKKTMLEDFEYLVLDELIASRKWIKDFFLNHDAIILTIRNDRKNLIKQLDFLNISFINSKVISLISNGTDTKLDWVNKNIGLNESKIIIGDSETDLKIGLLKNTKVYLVETGLRNPAYIIESSKIEANIISHISSYNAEISFNV